MFAEPHVAPNSVVSHISESNPYAPHSDSRPTKPFNHDDNLVWHHEDSMQIPTHCDVFSLDQSPIPEEIITIRHGLRKRSGNEDIFCKLVGCFLSNRNKFEPANRDGIPIGGSSHLHYQMAWSHGNLFHHLICQGVLLFQHSEFNEGSSGNYSKINDNSVSEKRFAEGRSFLQVVQGDTPGWRMAPTSCSHLCHYGIIFASKTFLSEISRSISMRVLFLFPHWHSRTHSQHLQFPLCNKWQIRSLKASRIEWGDDTYTWVCTTVMLTLQLDLCVSGAPCQQ